MCVKNKKCTKYVYNVKKMNLFDEHDLVERKREVIIVFNLQLLPYTRLHTLSFRFEQFKKKQKQKHAIFI